MKVSGWSLIQMTCKICNTRRPRRYCPGVEGDICPICCATEREVTVNCPLTCKYLIESRETAKEPAAGKDLPHDDLKFPAGFMERSEPFIVLTALVLARAAREQPPLLDSDLQAALASTVQTYKTLQSGLIYESKPENPYAAAYQQKVLEYLAEAKQTLNAERPGTLDDRMLLACLAFLHRLAVSMDNGRPKGRAFIQWLYLGFKPIDKPADEPQLIL